MESITAARNISGLEPMSVLHGIAPLCVPMSVSEDFADEVGNRAVPRIVSLWERLGLFYMLEQPQTAPVSNTRVTVNNFTAQMIFRLCSFSHTDRLIERYQPGSVFPENIRRASQENVRMIRSAEMRRVFRALTENSRYTEEVGRVFRLIFEKETGGIPLQTVCRALAALLGSSGGGAVFTAQQRRIFERIAAVLGSEYPESPAAVEISRLGSASGFTEEQRARILSAVGKTGNRPQTDAAQIVVQLAERGKSAVEAAELIRREVRSYGFTERHYDRESIREMIGAVPGRIAPAGRSAAFIAADPESAAARNGAARPAGGIYEAAALLYQELSGTGSDDSAGKTDSSTTQQNVEFRRLSGKMTAGISAVFSDILNSAQYGLNNPRYQVERRIPDRIFRENVLGKAVSANAETGKPGGIGIPGTSEHSEKAKYAGALNPASEITMKFYADSPAGRLLEQISDGMVNSESRRGISEYSRQFEIPVSELLAGARLNAGAGIDFGEKQGLSESGEAHVVPMNNMDAPQDVTQTMALPEPILNNFQAEETGANSVSLWSSFEKSVEGRLTSLFSEISRNVNFGGRTIVLSGSDTHSESMRTVQNQVCITAPALRRILSRFSFETDIYSTAQHSNSDTALTSVVNETTELLRRYSFEENRHQNSPETHIYQDYSFRETSGFSEKNTIHNSSTALTFNNAVQKENEEAPAHSTSKNTNHPTGAVLPPEPQSNAAQREQLILPERSTSETANHLTGTLLSPEPQSNAAQREQLILPERSTSETANQLAGAVLPPEPQSNAAQTEQLTIPERSTSENVNQLTGTVLSPEPQSNAAQREQLILPERSTSETANQLTGAVLPPEPQSKAAQREQLTLPERSISETVNQLTGAVLPPEPQSNAAEPDQLTLPERSISETANQLAGAVLPPEPQSNAAQREQLTIQERSTSENANNLTGAVLPPEPQSNAVQREQLILPERSTSETANQLTGTVLPPEPQSNAAQREQLILPERSTSETANQLTGTVLPPEPQSNAAKTEQLILPERSTSETANHLTGTLLSPEPQSKAAQRKQLTLPERSTSETANNLTGAVLPPEPQSNAAKTELLTPLAQSETQNNERRTAGSYRDRLDNKTLSVIDQLIAETRQPVPVPEIKEAIPEPEPELNYISSEKSVESSDVIRSVNIVRESIVRHTESHMSRLIERAYRNSLPEQPEKKPFTFRTAENTENMLMLVPPTEMDRYRAQQPYMNSLPPIELKEPQPAQAPAETSRTVTTNRQVTVNTSVDGGISSLTRDEISRLTDKVYERIENRLARERRRMGL
ncbi:MAG TPA: hypothetical protein DIV52_06685 [Ruminococcaceae bacterium]|nr:hypothetical protein [Oscillospiraceae bacterium]